MQYVSTRGGAPHLDFKSATLAGLAPDGGLYVPQRWPVLSHDEIAALANKSYVETAVTVMWPFVAGCLSQAELRSLCTQAYGQFAHGAVTPLVQLDRNQWLLELFHGPTLAFKDVALQMLGLLFEKFLTGSDKHLTIVGATSGDTGSAAIRSVTGREQIDIFMLHPAGRVSEVQRRQMTTVHAPNVHNIAIEGSFDDAQGIVKTLFNDREFSQRFTLSAVNSINWARLCSQIVYYFYAAVRLGAPEREIAFSVPTGNFGDVFAGYVAAQMGLPVSRLIVATNINDILYRALTSGDYVKGLVVPTASPSMDIQVSSNFERLLFDLSGQDAPVLRGMMESFESAGSMVMPASVYDSARALFSSARIDASEMCATMVWAKDHAGQIVDPHTAIGLAAARKFESDTPVVTLATAHPAKFPDAVEQAIGVRPALPDRVADIFQHEERYVALPATAAAIKNYVSDRVPGPQ